jgi:DUF4097 and DUF4098 domain-containing protein YvlB
MNRATKATLSGVLLAFVWAMPCYAAVDSGDLAGKRVDLSEAAKPDGFVKISIVRGDLIVEGWDKDEVSLVGTLDEKTEQFIFDVSGRDTRIIVKIPSNNTSWCCNEGSNLRIMVPKGSQVDVATVSTEVRLTDIRGGLDMSGVSGDVRIQKVSERLRVRNVSGEITVHDVDAYARIKTVSGEIDARSIKGGGAFHTVSGEIVLRDVTDEIDVESVSGDIEVIGRNISLARGHSVSGDIDLEIELIDDALVEFDSVSGSVRLRLDGKLNHKFDLETGSGSIRNRITDDKPKKSKYIRDEQLRFTVGEGDGQVNVSTRSGDISVSK